MSRFSFLSTELEPERVLLVGVDFRNSAWPVERSLDELERLAHTAGAVTVGRVVQRLDKPIPKSFIGSGKVDEVRHLVSALDVNTVIFDDDLSPAQQSHLEKTIGEPTKIIDRTALILDIFGLHAKTREGRIQVQLAQLQYLLPRLRGMWSHLAKEQTRGGIGSRFGQGESQLEVDRRLIRNKIASLRRELDALEKRRDVQAKSRKESTAFRIALAGYTNAGKSTLLNALTDAGVLSEDKLFATLDPTTRSYSLPGGRVVTITDTVGFIQKLPHGLVEAFKSTLSEVLEADLILKIVDISDEDADLHLEAVDRVLDEIGAGQQLSVTVNNKCDRFDAAYVYALESRYPDQIFCSAHTGYGMDALIDCIALRASASDRLMTVMLPYSCASLRAQIHEQGVILTEEFLSEGMLVTAKVPSKLAGMLQRYEHCNEEIVASEGLTPLSENQA